MKLLIAGGRDLVIGVDGMLMFIGYFFNNNHIAEIVSGGATGIDSDGEAAADACLLPVRKFPADWNTHGKAAGPIRNKQMAEYADALLLIWNGESRGSANMKKEMLKLNKPVYEIIIKTTGVKI